jgi:hypothetical protein
LVAQHSQQLPQPLVLALITVPFARQDGRSAHTVSEDELPTA